MNQDSSTSDICGAETAKVVMGWASKSTRCTSGSSISRGRFCRI
jgi:hypothetical protein